MKASFVLCIVAALATPFHATALNTRGGNPPEALLAAASLLSSTHHDNQETAIAASSDDANATSADVSANATADAAAEGSVTCSTTVGQCWVYTLSRFTGTRTCYTASHASGIGGFMSIKMSSTKCSAYAYSATNYGGTQTYIPAGAGIATFANYQYSLKCTCTA